MTKTSAINNFTYLLLNYRTPELSPRAKEAIKVGIAYSLTFLITLKFGWLNPYWAGFAVAQVALFPNGQSLHHGALRLAGLIPAMLAPIVIFMVAAQDRWLFIFLVSLWMMFATYMMIRDEKRSYMWNVAGFASLYIFVTNFTTSLDIFQSVVARSLDTSLGIIMYTLVTVFIWPETNVNRLKKISVGLTSIQAKIFSLIGSAKYLEDEKASLRALINQEIQSIDALKQAFFAKGSETYEVQEAAAHWKKFHLLCIQLSQSYNRLNNSFLGLQKINISELMPKIDGYKQQINKHFELAGEILNNGAQELHLQHIVFEVNEEYLRSLSPFDQFAFASSLREFNKIQNISKKILECANNIVDENISNKVSIHKPKQTIYEKLTPDSDYAKRVFFVGTFTMLVFSIWIFFDPPGHMSWLQLPPTVAMIVAGTPQLKTNSLVFAGFIILSFFLLVYSVIMPRLSGAMELGTLLFLCMFGVFYFLDGVHRLLGVIAATTKLSVHNEQVYDFIASANMLLLSVFSYSILFVYSYILGSPRPQRVFLSNIRKYFRSAEFLIADLQNTQKYSVLRKFQVAFHSYEFKHLPLRIKSWSMPINYQHFDKNSRSQIEDFTIAIHSLSNSLEEYFSSKKLTQTHYILDETKGEFQRWSNGNTKCF